MFEKCFLQDVRHNLWVHSFLWVACKPQSLEEKRSIIVRRFTDGPVFQSLLRFAIPVLGALILQAAYGAVDLLIVGKFGNASSISAVGTGSSFMQMATFIITSLAMGPP